MIYLIIGFNILVTILSFVGSMSMLGKDKMYLALALSIAIFILLMVITGRIYEKRKNGIKKKSKEGSKLGVLGECGCDALECIDCDGVDGLDIFNIFDWCD
ncbi:hypothetical protein [uncultured Clostridium sp.]|uniref:hypothetical protein n=1 Tax=uncultured Clostridium sp. TaxID=59620 RepID=UPI00263A1F70|nr:hypothetical protein [uncultured Clostridium sp.]